MSKTLQFKVFCFEAYRAEKKMTGWETMQLFEKYGVLEYLEACYDVLHTTGRQYMIEDIDEFINVRKEKECAKNKIEQMRQKGTVVDYDAELASYRDAKYGN